MTELFVALGLIAVSALVVVTEYIGYRKEQDRKAERKEVKEDAHEAIKSGNLTRVGALAGRLSED